VCTLFLHFFCVFPHTPLRATCPGIICEIVCYPTYICSELYPRTRLILMSDLFSGRDAIPFFACTSALRGYICSCDRKQFQYSRWFPPFPAHPRELAAPLGGPCVLLDRALTDSLTDQLLGAESFLKVGSRPASQELSHIIGTIRFIAVFTRVRHLTLF
jgi:hypothetical protein